MEIQIKLYKVFDSTKEDTLSKLCTYLGEEKIEKINKNIIAIHYDYLKNPLKEIDKITKNMDIENVIIINDTFYGIITKSIRNNFKIQKINLKEHIDNIDENIKDCIDRINDDGSNMQEAIDDLIYELDWASSEEYIDIDDINIRIKSKDELVLVQMNRSGEILLDLSILDEVKSLIKENL